MVVGDWNLYIGGNVYLHCQKPSSGVLSLNFGNKFRNGHTVSKGVNKWVFKGYLFTFFSLTQCFEKRLIPACEIYDNGISVTYSRIGWDHSYHYKNIIMTSRDYYIKHVDDYLHEYTAGYNESNIMSQWMENPASGFNHILKPALSRPFPVSLNGIYSGVTDDIEIKVSPCV